MVDRGEPEVWLLCNASSSRLPLMLLHGGNLLGAKGAGKTSSQNWVPSNKDVSQFDIKIMRYIPR